MNLKEKLQEVINNQEYHLEEYKEQLANAMKTPAVKIGFIGKFSSGKSSLINTLLSTNLPVNIKPTTKTVCIIKSCKEVSSPKYYKENGLTRKEIDFDEFITLICGDEEGIVSVDVPVNDILPEGVIFVDTPGIDSANESDKEKTFAYLSFMDAALFCIAVTDGSIDQTGKDFLFNENLKHLHNRIAFVITMKDRYSEEDRERVKKRIAEDLAKWYKEKGSDLNINNLENKIFLSSSKDKDDCIALYKKIEAQILSNKSLIYERRKEDFLKKLANDIVTHLKELQSVPYDEKDIETEKEKTEEELKTIKQQLEENGYKLDSLKKELERKIEKVMIEYADMFAYPNSGDVKDIVNQMMDSVVSVSKSCIKKYIKDFELKSSAAGNIAARIKRRIELNDNIWNSIKTVTMVSITAAAAAWAGPAASAAGNAAEAAGGVLVAGAGDALKKEISKDIVKTAQKQIAKEAAKEVVKESGWKVFAKGALNIIAKSIDEMNPATHVERIVNPILKAKQMENMLRSYAYTFAEDISSMVETEFVDQILSPIQTDLKSKKEYIDRLDKQSDNRLFDYRVYKQNLEKDIVLLEKLS